MTTHRIFDESQGAQQSGRTPSSKPPKIEYPSEEPFEDHVAHTKSHSMACTALERSIEEAYADIDISVGGDQFVYYVEGDPTQCLAPDVFVKLEHGVKNFDSWLSWEEGTPDLAVEIVSAWDRMKLTWEEKFARYEASGIAEVVRFDPKGQGSIRIWDRKGERLVERSLKPGRPMECRALKLYWTVRVHPDYGRQLRLAHDRAGHDLLPTPSETVLELATQIVAERTARSVAEHEQRVSKILQQDAEQKMRQEMQARLRAEQKTREEVEARALAEQKTREEAEARALAEQKTREEAQARAIAEQKQHEEAQARLRAEEKTREAEEKIAALLAELERRGGKPQAV